MGWIAHGGHWCAHGWPSSEDCCPEEPVPGIWVGKGTFSFLHVVVCPCQQQPVSMDTFCLFCIKGIFEVKILTLTLMWHVGAELPATNLVFSQNSLSDDYAHHLARAFPECWSSVQTFLFSLQLPCPKPSCCGFNRRYCRKSLNGGDWRGDSLWLPSSKVARCWTWLSSDTVAVYIDDSLLCDGNGWILRERGR